MITFGTVPVSAYIYKGVKIKRNIKRLIVMVLGLWLALQILPRYFGNKDFEKFLKEDTGKEIINIQLLSEADLAARKKLTAQEVYKNVCNCVVTVYVKENGRKISQGTGSIISKDKNNYYYILTNKHVVFSRKTGIKHPVTYEIRLYTDANTNALSETT